MHPLAFHPHNPTRPPRWRWGRAAALHEAGRRATRLDDAWVRRARRVIAALGRLGSDVGHPGLAAVDPPAVAALRLRLRGGRLRSEAEARILAGQDDGAIAPILGVDPGVVGAYERLFFDVRGALDRIDYLAACVFGPRLYDGRGAGDEDLALKLIGYNVGPVALDVYLGRPRPDLRDPRRLAAALRLYVGVSTAAPGEAPRWACVAAMLDALDREAADRAGEAGAAVRVPDGFAATLRDALVSAGGDTPRPGAGGEAAVAPSPASEDAGAPPARLIA